MQRPRSVDKEISLELLSVSGLDNPHLLLLLPSHVHHFVTELHERPEIVLGCHTFQVLPDLTPFAIGLGPAAKIKRQKK